MTCDFTSFSSAFQSYQDDDWPVLKVCVLWSFFYGQKAFRLKRGSNPGSQISKPTLNPLSYWASVEMDQGVLMGNFANHKDYLSLN